MCSKEKKKEEWVVYTIHQLSSSTSTYQQGEHEYIKEQNKYTNISKLSNKWENVRIESNKWIY